MSWSPRALVDAEPAIRGAVLDLFKQDLSEAAGLVADIGTITQKRSQGAPWSGVAVSYDNESNLASKNAVAMVEAAVAEIVQSARVAMEAKTREDRPQYLITNTFTAPVGGVAQGQASIGFITQSNAATSRNQLEELVRLMSGALAEVGDTGAKETAPALQVVKAEAGSEHPDGGIIKAAIERVAGFVERAGSSAAGGAFLGFARAHGWLP
jgi:hypothetical protein